MVFALFSTLIDSYQKQNLAGKMVSTDKPKNFRQGKPGFPDVTSTTTFESHLLFHTLNIKTDWMLDPEKAWQHIPEFKNAVKSLKVVNDIAECGEKIIVTLQMSSQ